MSEDLEEILEDIKMYPENQISKVHYVLQLLACLDVVSSVILLGKYKKQVKDC